MNKAVYWKEYYQRPEVKQRKQRRTRESNRYRVYVEKEMWKRQSPQEQFNNMWAFAKTILNDKEITTRDK